MRRPVPVVPLNHPPSLLPYVLKAMRENIRSCAPARDSTIGRILIVPPAVRQPVAVRNPLALGIRMDIKYGLLHRTICMVAVPLQIVVVVICAIVRAVPKSL